jgi:hypothetical protein
MDRGVSPVHGRQLEWVAHGWSSFRNITCPFSLPIIYRNLHSPSDKKGAVDCVVVYKLDHLSRSVMDTVNLVLCEWDGLT